MLKSNGLATCLGVIACLIATVPAQATINDVHPADDNGPNADFKTNDALWAIGINDPTTGAGQLCVVDYGANLDSGCDTGSWGKPNAVGVLGTYHQPIVAPYLPPGTYQILADNGDPALNHVSEPFTVTPCDPGNCSAAIAQAQLDEWKADAQKVVDDFKGGCLAATAYLVSQSLRSGAGTLSKLHGAQWISLINDGISNRLNFSNPIGTLQDKAMDLLATVACNAYHMYEDIIADPPDADFKHVLDPTPDAYPSTGDLGVDKTVAALERMRAGGAASRVGVERFKGAEAAGDAGWQAWHESALGAGALQAQRGMRRAPAGLRAFAGQLDLDPNIAGATPTQLAHVRDVRERVRVSGFLPDEITELQGLGYTATDIAEIRQQLGTPLPPGLSVTDPADALRAMADGLDKIACVTPASTCAFDALGRTAAAVGAIYDVKPKVLTTNPQLPEGDIGLNHRRLDLKLDHPSINNTNITLALTPQTTAPGEVTLIGSPAFVEAGDTRLAAGVLVTNDTADEPDETATLSASGTNVGLTPDRTVTVVDDDPHEPVVRGPHGMLALSDAGGPGLWLGEPGGSELEKSWTPDVGNRVVTGWSPQGRFLLIHYNPSTAVDLSANGARYSALPIDPDGHVTGPPVPITPPGQTGVQGFTGASISADGTRLALSHLGSNFDLEVVPVDATGAAAGPPHITADDHAMSGFTDEIAESWSPDGSHIAFEGCRTGYSQCGIYVVAVDAGGAATGPPTTVVEDPAHTYLEPSWSPDGRFIAVVHHAFDGTSTLERLAVDGAGIPTGPPVVLATSDVLSDAYSSAPSWAPDSRTIAYLTTLDPLLKNAGCSCVWAVDLDSTGHAAGGPRSISPFGWDVGAAVFGTLHDIAPPVTTATADPPANAAGWQGANVTVTLTAIDDRSGVASITAGTTTHPGDRVAVPVSGDGEHTLSYHARDVAGNDEATRTLVIRIDTTAPDVQVASPAAGATVPAGTALRADYTCADGGSGIDTCAGDAGAGSLLDTLAPGARTLGVTATDRAGNRTSLSRAWSVSGKPAPAPAGAIAPVKLTAPVLPSNRKCVSRRRFRIRLVQPKTDLLAEAVVTVNGKRVKVVRGSRLTAPIDLRGLPAGRIKVKIVATTKSGRQVSATRAYRTCAKRKPRR